MKSRDGIVASITCPEIVPAVPLDKARPAVPALLLHLCLQHALLQRVGAEKAAPPPQPLPEATLPGGPLRWQLERLGRPACFWLAESARLEARAALDKGQRPGLFRVVLCAITVLGKGEGLREEGEELKCRCLAP